MIEINNVDFAYKKNQKIFDDLCMQFKKGSIHGLLGKNGSGKTTLMKLIAGLRYPGKGFISINQKKSIGRSPEYLSKLFIIPEEFDFPAITIKSFIKVNSVFYDNFEEDQFYYYLDEFDVPKDAIITTLSLGQKKKFLLAYGFATNTKVLLLDEPTNGLDIPSKVQFRKILAGLTDENRIFIISTHQIKDIEEIIDSLSIIDDGGLRFTTSIEEMSQRFVFGEKDALDLVQEDMIFEEKSFGGSKVLGVNRDNNYTPIDLELLFNAVINKGKTIQEIFDNIKININV